MSDDKENDDGNDGDCEDADGDEDCVEPVVTV